MNNQTLSRLFRFWEADFVKSAEREQSPPARAYLTGKAEAYRAAAMALECEATASCMVHAAKCFGFEREGNR